MELNLLNNISLSKGKFPPYCPCSVDLCPPSRGIKYLLRTDQVHITFWITRVTEVAVKLMDIISEAGDSRCCVDYLFSIQMKIDSLPGAYTLLDLYNINAQ